MDWKEVEVLVWMAVALWIQEVARWEDVGYWKTHDQYVVVAHKYCS
jgi:hypothetical protein